MNNHLNQTPNASRLHIGIFGKRNSGKSTLLNALTGQTVSLVSSVLGTTTDPVYKAMEIHPIGPCMFIDTAGFDDMGDPLGKLRVEKTQKSMDQTDVAILLFSASGGSSIQEQGMVFESQWIKELQARKIPLLAVLNKSDLLKEAEVEQLKLDIQREFQLEPLVISAEKSIGIDQVKEEVFRLMPQDYQAESIVGPLVSLGDTVLLVMPQDVGAPKGRLILPQVQTIRDLLDHQCIVISVTTDQFESALDALSKPPKLIITDSQVFAQVYAKKPESSLLTSFSVLFAAYKGDMEAFMEGAEAMDSLNETSHVLIAEACTHAPLSEDIGREKIPKMLRKKYGEGLQIHMASGSSFPKELSEYDLIIHCGACMFNRKLVLSRIQKAKAAHVPITNYGIAIAKLNGILNQIHYKK